MRDPFHKEIVAGLEGRLNPDTFEHCAADLLGQVYPGLVPVPGGNDAGMDGAIADGEGEPLPLVTTTSERVIRNLDRNLRSYCKKGGRRRKVVLATSRRLTPARRRNLYARARELGFTLVQIHDEAWFADALYRSPRWCRELLGLIGKPPALSAVPRTPGRLLSQSLIGRSADLAWLTASEGDRLLVGQPGIGKTFLLRQLVNEGRALFVVGSDTAEIAAALRELGPGALIVDDAQLDRELIFELQRMREEFDAVFAIIATCWPGDRDAVAEALGVAERDVRCLDRLTRPQIVEVVEGAGIRGPTELVREIVNQAEGRPGLAVTLAHACLHGGVRDLVSGEALRRWILTRLESVAEEDVEAILAAFAVGGDTGMAKEAVAKGLGLPVLAVRRVLANLAAAGVIREVDRVRVGGVIRRGATSFLSVRPVALRNVLLRDVFFSGALSLQIEPFLSVAPNPVEAALILIGAKHHGAAVPEDLLKSVVEQAPAADVLAAYASLGQDHVKWVLGRHPDAIVAIARPALHNAPELAIPLLLEAAIGDERELGPHPAHPLRLLGDWIAAGRPGTDQALGRRRAVLVSVVEWISSKRDCRLGLRALQLALSPAFLDVTSDPGLGNKITITDGCIMLHEMGEMQSWWPEVVTALAAAGIDDWEPLAEIIEEWALASRVHADADPAISQAMQAFAAAMLRDVVVLAGQHPGILRRLQGTAGHLKLDVEVPADPVFDALYPPKDTYGDPEARDVQVSAIRELAEAWAGLDGPEVAQLIASVEAEARLADLRWPRLTPQLCSELAERVACPTEWGVAMVTAACPGDAVEPFLRRAALANDEGWERLAHDCLTHATLKDCATSVVLTLSAPPTKLLEDVLLSLQGSHRAVEVYCIRNEVSESVVQRLLEHQDDRIAAAAALGEWYADPKGSVRQGLRSQWRRVVVQRIEGEHWLSDVFAADPELAADWIRARLREHPEWSPGYERAAAAAASVLDTETRALILQELCGEDHPADLVARLVGDSSDLYRELLDRRELGYLHLAALAGYPEGAWIDKAKVALDRGYEAKQVALAALRALQSVAWGNRSAIWADWVERFEALCLHEDPAIRAVGKAGAEFARKERDRELKEERHEAVYGID